MLSERACWFWPIFTFGASELQPSLPQHIAIIMDGNGRWAKERFRPRLWGHKNGVDSVREVVRSCGELGIKVLTLFAFSEENWGRPVTEVSGLMELLNNAVLREKDELNANNVRLSLIGDLDRLPTKTRDLLQGMVADLAGNTGLILYLALSFGGRGEIVHAAQTLARQVREGLIDPEQIDADRFAKALFTADLPDPDLVIRTSGELRVSNFLLWQLAYAELWFTPVHWPDFRRKHLDDAIAAFQGRRRRFGLIDDAPTLSSSEVIHETGQPTPC